MQSLEESVLTVLTELIPTTSSSTFERIAYRDHRTAIKLRKIGFTCMLNDYFKSLLSANTFVSFNTILTIICTKLCLLTHILNDDDHQTTQVTK